MSILQNQRIVVVGGSGFLGSHVADALSNAGYKVTIFDRSASSWKRDDQEMVIGDILNYEEIAETIKGSYAVYNFAAIADLDEAKTKPIETARINVLGNVNILDACVRNKVDRYVYASTVYVNSREGGFYRCSKQAAEQYVEQYWRSYGLNYTILRYGSLYGPRADHHNGLWRIVNYALETGKISYKGSSEAMREYIHVIDAARASVVALGQEFCNEHLVLTGQEPMRVMDLLKMLAEILSISQDIEFVDNIQEGHYIRTPYAYQSKISRKYIPSLHIDLGQGLLEMVTNIKNDNNKKEW
jgi:UDP-glucose 4-epimerase